MRMLEAEFGGKQKAPEDDEEKVGSVDPKGKLITDGPKKRIAVRCIEVLLAATSSVASIYSALIIKPSSSPPPANKLPAYLLYILSFLTVLSTIYLFLIYPCCCGSRPRSRDAAFEQGPGGLMVLPVQSLPGGGKKGKGGKGKKHKGGGGASDGVQVNLIVDPTMFGSGRQDEDEWEDEQGEDGETELGPPGSYAPRRRRPRRRGIFAGLALEAQWKRARKQLKVGMVFDVVAWVLWGAVFVVVLMGKRCPVGGYNGWCDAYNLASAAACLLCVSFGVSIFFDIKDLHASKASPRTRP
ncbi:hypothetical protein POSPLADRAFT_1044802 [Postia placenta MAD-698-R-SB12]|uniref:MARVEL domain-containing protein n=1 Tax=Postia placenta MAD-698-R-SB12 TaxID=670580 RepID=A0A1X6N9V2_9APHY|nr:hypothetical protein POSPLADRAFT_1044802 [Postia placenta MAD-698-R-SB12]OSX65427.1 hypothetical protein POSPLADRAFT_1044802 [Postia placenta MAD-698-R-SB12]